SGDSRDESLALSNVRIPIVDQEVFEGGDPLVAIEVTADLSGDLSKLGQVFVVVEDRDQLFSTAAVSPGANGRDNRLIIQGRPINLVAGTFSGPLRVFVCLDVECQRTVAGSPVIVPYTITVRPGIKMNFPTPLTVATGAGSPRTLELPITLPPGTEAWSAAFDFGPNGIAVTNSDTPSPRALVDISALGVGYAGDWPIWFSATARTSKGRVATVRVGSQVFFRSQP
ncbi:MAG TPA: hypothetical protein VFL64_01785, partial [Rhizobacter sp.]|nr:hypothetical protein [Rhizobacter sp.]